MKKTESAGGVVKNKEGKVLVISQHGTSWSLPKGHIEEGEDTSELKVIHMFLYTTNETNLKPIDPENPEARWVEPQQVADLLTHPKDKEFFLKILPVI